MYVSYFFGDSNTYKSTSTPASHYTTLPDPINYGVPGAKITDILQRLSDPIIQHGDYVILQGGINDIVTGASQQSVIDGLTALRDTALQHTPNVLLLPIYPYGPYSVVIEAINNALGLTQFLELEDPDNPGCLHPWYGQSDGIHLAPVGQRLVAKYIDAHFLGPDPTWGKFPLLQTASWDMQFDQGQWLSREWECWHKPIFTNNNEAYATGFCGAFACGVAPPQSYMIECDVDLDFAATSHFSVVCEGAWDHWVQVGYNFQGTDRKFAIRRWRKGISYDDYYVHPTEHRVSAEVSRFEHNDFSLNLKVAVHDGKLWVWCNNVLRTPTPITLPQNLPADRRLGFWGNGFKLHNYHVSVPDLRPYF